MTIAGALVRVGIGALLINEIRGAILAVPVIYGMFVTGGTWMALWLGFCSLVGIALSVAVPVLIARKFIK